MSRKKQKLPESAVVTIEALSHDGRGVAHIDGKTVFVDNALPGETVRIRYLRSRSRHDEAETEAVLRASPERVEPFCPYFQDCGGCSMQHLDPAAQLQHKQAVLLEQFRHIGRVEPGAILQPLTGPVRGYRHKARLGVKYVFGKEKLLVGFREKRSSFIADIDACDVLHPSVGQLLPDLKSLISGLSCYNRIPQVEVSVGDARTALVLRHLQPLTDEDKTALRAFEREHDVVFYLQPGGPDTVAPLSDPDGEDDLFYRFEDEGVTLHFGPLDFTQVNFTMNRSMLKRIRELLQPGPDDRVLDLFCGLGNFTLPLARFVARITGVEGDAALVQKARANAAANRIDNAEFHRADLHRQDLQAAFLRGSYDKLLLDPPRSGAREILSRLPAGIRRIVYVSCNPATLARDAGVLAHERGFELASAGVMDMFPHTAHVESIALFTRE